MWAPYLFWLRVVLRAAAPVEGPTLVLLLLVRRWVPPAAEPRLRPPPDSPDVSPGRRVTALEKSSDSDSSKEPLSALPSRPARPPKSPSPLCEDPTLFPS